MLNTPSILPGWIIAGLANLIALPVAFGAPLSGEQQASLLAAVEFIVAVVIFAEAYVRGQRASNAKNIAEAKAVEAESSATKQTPA